MGKNKNKKKAKGQRAAEADSPTREIARSETETPDKHQPGSYAAAAAESPTKETKFTDNPTLPKITVEKTISDSADPVDEPASVDPTTGIFEDDAIDVALLSTPNVKQNKQVDDFDSDFSRLKKDEISEAGSPGQVVEKEPSKADPFADGKELEQKGGQPADSPAETKTAEDGMGTEIEANPQSNMKKALFSQKASNSLVRSISKAEWEKTFASEKETGEDVDAAGGAEASVQDVATGTTPSHPAVMENRRLAQAMDEMEAALYESRVLHQEATDELDLLEQERARLEEDRDRYKEELKEARETLQSVHERRQKLQDEKDKHRMREADWEKEKQRSEAQIEQLTQTQPVGCTSGSSSASPLKIDKFNHSPSDPSDNAALKDEIRQLQKQLQDSQDELEKARDELKTFRVYKKKQEDGPLIKAKIAACATENEKLHRFGGTLDLASQLYRTLKKLADFHDDGGPEPTSVEYAQMKQFKDCVDERRRIMFQARTHPDPRAFMKPYLDKWYEIAEKGDWGSTLDDRIMATKVALDRHYKAHDLELASQTLGIQRE